MRVVEGDNTIFSVYGVQDAMDELTFSAPSFKAQFRVSQLMRTAGPQPFRLEINVR